jgi:[acyl-carrier-protein] S-malonyltransferase
MLNVIGDIKVTKDLFERFLNTIEDKEYVNISSLHSKRLLVLSGKKTLIQKCSQFYKENNIPSKNLNVSAAFHSKLMEEGKNKFEKYLNNVQFKYPKYKLLSSVTGNIIEETEDFDNKIKEVLVSQFVSPIRLLQCYEICQEGSLKILDVVKRKILDEKEIL